MNRFNAVLLMGLISFCGCSSVVKPQSKVVMEEVAPIKANRTIANEGILIGQGAQNCERVSYIYKAYADNNCDEYQTVNEETCHPLRQFTSRNADFGLGYIAGYKDRKNLKDEVYKELALKMEQLNGRNPYVLSFCEKNWNSYLIDYIKQALKK